MRGNASAITQNLTVMQFLNFTPQEIRALLFLLTALLAGSGITLYKRTHPQFAPELVVRKSPQSTVHSPPNPNSINTERAIKKTNLNTATTAELELLPGLGPKLSQRIVEHRKTNGEFKKVEDVLKVPGIGPKVLEQIKDYVTVE